MKHLLFIVVLFTVGGFMKAQEATDEFKQSLQKQMVKLSTDRACMCIDSINTHNKPQEQIAKEINDCIDKQMMGYQMMSQFSSLKPKLDKLKSRDSIEANTDNKIEHNVVINTNKDSPNYQKYYYEFERYLMDSCKSLSAKVASDNRLGDHSMSENMLAQRWYEKGGIALESGKYDRAIEYFTKALKVDSVFTFAWDNLGLSYRKNNDLDNAIRCYKKSIQIDPKGAMPWQNLAFAYEHKKEFDNAIRAYEELAKLDDNNPEVYYGLGNIYAIHLKDYEKGADNMCKAYVLYVGMKSPYRTDAETMLGRIYSAMKKDGKLELLNKILKKHNMTPVEE